MLLLFIEMLLILDQVLKDLNDGVDDGVEDNGGISISRMTIDICKILKNHFHSCLNR